MKRCWHGRAHWKPASQAGRGGEGAGACPDQPGYQLTPQEGHCPDTSGSQPSSPPNHWDLQRSYGKSRFPERERELPWSLGAEQSPGCRAAPASDRLHSRHHIRVVTTIPVFNCAPREQHWENAGCSHNSRRLRRRGSDCRAGGCPRSLPGGEGGFAAALLARETPGLLLQYSRAICREGVQGRCASGVCVHGGGCAWLPPQLWHLLAGGHSHARQPPLGFTLQLF